MATAAQPDSLAAGTLLTSVGVTEAPAHWAKPGQPCAADAAGNATKLLAGGDLAKPETMQCCWEWDLATTVTRTAPAAGGGGAAAGEAAATVCHRGGSHCGDVRFEADAPASLVVWDCNCSNCRMRRNIHFVVPSDKLRMLSEPAKLAEYRFGTGVARHLFCARCGISPFYRPRSNPDGWGITFQCIDPGTVQGVEVRRFDGHNWEGFIEQSGIKEFSKSD